VTDKPRPKALIGNDIFIVGDGTISAAVRST